VCGRISRHAAIRIIHLSAWLAVDAVGVLPPQLVAAGVGVALGAGGRTAPAFGGGLLSGFEFASALSLKYEAGPRNQYKQ